MLSATFVYMPVHSHCFIIIYLHPVCSYIPGTCIRILCYDNGCCNISPSICRPVLCYGVARQMWFHNLKFRVFPAVHLWLYPTHFLEHFQAPGYHGFCVIWNAHYILQFKPYIVWSIAKNGLYFFVRRKYIAYYRHA